MKPPSQNIRILLLEESKADADLVSRELRRLKAAYALRHVSVRDEFLRALDDFPPDLILSDYALPNFNGMTALSLAREKNPEVPFIFISGSIGEENAIEVLKGGATDYVLKSSIQRVLPAVERALRETRDREERGRLQEQLRQSQKMETVGRLAGGVAHDFNNILTAISGYSHFLLAAMSADDPKRPDVEEIQKASKRASSLTRQLLTFSRQQIFHLELLDVSAVALEMEKMLRRLLGENMELDVRSAKNLGKVKADQGQLEQVILNLVVNASEAMPNGGKITLEAADIELGEDYARSHPEMQPGPHVMLSVSDTGSGMDSKILSQIFEPFFTTKQFGRGTGLGLSIVYGIVRQSRGGISVASQPGRGTTFKIYLPRAADSADSVDLSFVKKKAVPGTPPGSETVLLVEDDEIVQKVVGRILTGHGYRVLSPRTTDEALRLGREYKEDIHLLLTDIVMPGMRGYELARHISSARPAVKIIFISGYSETDAFKDELLRADANFVQKPIDSELLTRKVREALEG